VPNFASFINSSEKISIETIKLPALNDGEILVRNLCTSLCRSDIHTFQGKRKEKSPTILGHEIVGVIDSFGPNAPTHDIKGNVLKVGDKITWALYASSPNDELSKIGIPQKAKDLFKYGHEQINEHSHFHGGLSEYTILRKNTAIIVLHKDLPNELATLINCSVATVAGAIRIAGDLTNKSVIIYGTGMLGIIACAMASKMSAAEIIAIDENIERLNISTQFGATKTLLAKDCVGFKADVVLEFSGAIPAMENSINMLNIGGIVILIGAVYAQPKVVINAEYFIRNILTIKGLHNYNHEDLITATAFMEENYTIFPFEKLIKKGFLLEDINSAFEYAINNNPFRVSVDL